MLCFTVYDADTGSRQDVSKIRLEDQDFLGQAECWLSEMVRAKGHVVTKELLPFADNRSRSAGTHGLGFKSRRGSLGRGARKMGSLTIHVEEVASQSHGTVMLGFRGTGLDRMDLYPFGKSDPYLKISKVLEDGSTAPICQTEAVSRSLNPVWRPIGVSLQILCAGDIDRPLRIECFDRDTFTRDDFIGSIDRSVRRLTEDVALQRGIPLKRESHKKGKPSKVGGTLFCTRCDIIQPRSFLQYLAMGCEVSFHVAVDFTASNGHPTSRDSLHYVDPNGRQNAYQQAISAVGRVIEFYDTNKTFPAWGFGACVGGEVVSHCFNLNGDPVNSEVMGVQGVLEAYEKARNVVSLAGPTLFTPVITRSSQMAEAHMREGRLKYSVLLIITDGIINDMESTMDALVAASRLPLSILIVGVGSADFSRMVALDSDDRPLKFGGLSAERDIVQFVSMRNITSDHQLAQELLAELPDQVVQFMSLGMLRVD
ncbi:hypothetical protein CBR_g39155 [Chara braunii]|uniref:C2 domain-containing protein n=1 Tax=Chara braunii TaxID=69332 RepID=A0A388LR17_CHABU|nr:hypothetical protein CBR_g39155 [Chara braunii]|eukprot:GBG84778.1 hypothetical protein CBR_g39155 [Chara braunii]